MGARHTNDMVIGFALLTDNLSWRVRLCHDPANVGAIDEHHCGPDTDDENHDPCVLTQGS